MGVFELAGIRNETSDLHILSHTYTFSRQFDSPDGNEDGSTTQQQSVHLVSAHLCAIDPSKTDAACDISSVASKRKVK